MIDVYIIQSIVIFMVNLALIGTRFDNHHVLSTFKWARTIWLSLDWHRLLKNYIINGRSFMSQNEYFVVI